MLVLACPSSPSFFHSSVLSCSWHYCNKKLSTFHCHHLHSQRVAWNRFCHSWSNSALTDPGPGISVKPSFMKSIEDSGSFLYYQRHLVEEGCQGNIVAGLKVFWSLKIQVHWGCKKLLICLASIFLLQAPHVLSTGHHPAALDLVTEEAISQPTGPPTHSEVRVKGYGSNNWAQILPVRIELTSPPTPCYKLRRT